MGDLVLCVPSLGCAVTNYLYNKTNKLSTELVGSKRRAERGKPVFKWSLAMDVSQQSGLLSAFRAADYPEAFIRYPIDGEVKRIPYWETFWSNDKLVHRKDNLPFTETSIFSRREMVLCIRTSHYVRIPAYEVYSELHEELLRVIELTKDKELKYLVQTEFDWVKDAICPVVSLEEFNSSSTKRYDG